MSSLVNLVSPWQPLNSASWQHTNEWTGLQSQNLHTSFHRCHCGLGCGRECAKQSSRQFPFSLDVWEPSFPFLSLPAGKPSSSSSEFPYPPHPHHTQEQSHNSRQLVQRAALIPRGTKRERKVPWRQNLVLCAICNTGTRKRRGGRRRQRRTKD